jgi:hypothetical protein
VNGFSPRRRGLDALVATISAVALLSGSCEPARASPVIPNDPGFATQWADRNTGQSIPGEEPPTGTPFADERSAEAWAVTTGSPSIVIGETDTGVDYEHPDLHANIWSNPGGKGGCVLPGTHGYNVLATELTPESCDPKDQDTSFGGHGTHVAGIMGAVGNNGIGVTGLNWHTTILPVKWLDRANTENPPSALVKALKWLVRVKQEGGANVRVVNDSATFNTTPNSAELEHEIKVLGENDILFVTSAGNSRANNDLEPRYPCNYDLPNEICVAASNNRDELPSWASYGPHTVDLAAPGAGIYSTLRREGKAENYGYLSGSSMAAAQVSGAAALILSAQPSLTAEQLKADIVNNIDKLPSLQGKVISGGRLDVCKALPSCINFGFVPPPAPASPPPPPPLPVPVIGALKITPSAFKAARSGPPISPRLARAGAKVSYTDSQPALTEFTVIAPRSGVRNAAKRCVPPPRSHSRARHGRHCTRYVSFGKFTRADSPGENRFRFSAHLGRSRLAPGHYRLRAVPSFAGQRGAEVRVAFRIVR